MGGVDQSISWFPAGEIFQKPSALNWENPIFVVTQFTEGKIVLAAVFLSTT